MRTLIMMLPMMFLICGLSACGTVTQKAVCQTVKEAEIRKLPACDISFQFQRCRCRCFDFNAWQTLPIAECPELNANEGIMSPVLKTKKGEARDFPLLYCEGLSGFFIDDMAGEIRPKVKRLNDLKKMYCD